MDSENVETPNVETPNVEACDVVIADVQERYESEEYMKYEEHTHSSGEKFKTVLEKLADFDTVDNYEKIRTLVDITVDDEEVCMKIYDLLYKYIESKKKPPPKEIYATKKCVICKRSRHLMQFIKNGRELKCCKSCREYQAAFRSKNEKK